MHPFRFAVQQGSARSGAAWTTTARRAESIGYDVLVMPDHLGQQLSPFAALAAAAAATTHLRIGRWAPTAIYGSPYVLYGTLASVREKLLRRREVLGISYYTVPGHAMESMAPLVAALAGK